MRGNMVYELQHLQVSSVKTLMQSTFESLEISEQIKCFFWNIHIHGLFHHKSCMQWHSLITSIMTEQLKKRVGKEDEGEEKEVFSHLFLSPGAKVSISRKKRGQTWPS